MIHTSKKPVIHPKIKFNLKLKMIALISLLIIGIFVIFGLFLRSFISTTMEDQIGKRALSVAQSVANIPEIKQAFQLEDPASVIQQIVTPIQQDTEAEFIVVGNREGIRYSHPEANQIGKKMIGGDNERALLKGESYISKRVGSLGLSIRGKVPVFADNGEIIGVVSVGFLNHDVQGIIKNQSKSLWLTLVAITLLGIIGAIFISNYLKKLLSDMEPEEISDLLVQKEAILQSTHEGIIAVNEKGTITMMNVAAQWILFKQIDQDNQFLGRPIKELLRHTDLFTVLQHGESHYNREMVLGENIVLVNRMPIYQDKRIVGAVSTFRKKTELAHLTNELMQIKQFANAQRAQTHEFSNKLYTILGLLQLDQKQEAIDFIKKENNVQQEWSQFLLDHVADPMIHGLLQGKFNQANELGITMSVDPDSQLAYCFNGEKQDALLTALGNLIENAMEAVRNIEGKRVISIFFTDIGEDVLIEIEDSGPGIAKEDAAHIFEQGFSTKTGSHRGTGLPLSNRMLQDIGGAIMLEDGELGGACFVIILPKDKGEDKNE
ncbi:GHKL domain-containing protein [Virgibacillus dakarensis]|uniref:histidine kinase n=1 Tax=Lentibacillus populi TaxID=1827502 RepID=A0A9W5TYU2_9BACI|nr:sensor histidine kinase [Lentibacillus populi]MTW85212.1 GHKL domain-containing protein [Virgibacillus dakarensis]GGB48671.1 sensor histidine kinase [Lentibacillus populi]